MFLNSFNYFRGIAIVFIVAGHCYGISGWWINRFPEKVLCAIVTGGTALFVFISGFLFHHVFYKKFKYKEFLMKKIKNVYSPYLILSSFPIFLYVFIWHHGPHTDLFFSHQGTLYSEYIRPTLLYLWTGRTYTAYWYISFIMVVFLISPIFIKFIETTIKVRIIFILATLSVAMVIHRPVLNMSVFQSVVYFVPIYLFGIFSSMHRDIIYTKLAGKELYLLTAIILLAVIQVVFYTTWGNSHKPPFEFAGLDLVIIQKLILCTFFMVLLQRLENRKVYILEELAASSFAIFFIHPIILEVMIQYNYVFPTKTWGIFSWLFSICFMTGASYIIAKILKKLLGEKSRMFIGW